MVRRISDNEYKYVKEVLDTEFRTSSGAKMMRKLEEKFASVFNAKFGVAFINGTATMHAALESFHFSPGDEVIVPPLTMSSTTFSVLQANLTPVFADIDADTFQIDPKSIEERITDRTKAIITVALYGSSPNMTEIVKICKKHNLKLIEDNAECYLGKHNGKLVGTFGDFASYSFQSSKHLTSGEGGMIITNSEEDALAIRRVQSLGYAGLSANKAKITKLDIQDPNYLRHASMGWNYRMPELCCAVALAQTERIEELVTVRQEAARFFLSASEGFEEWFKPQHIPHTDISSYWTWVVKLNTEKISWHDFRDRFIKNGGDGIYSAWQLSYLEPMMSNLNLLGRDRFISQENLSNYQRGLCPIAEDIQPKLLQFKTNYWNNEDAKHQAEILRNTLKQIN